MRWLVRTWSALTAPRRLRSNAAAVAYRRFSLHGCRVMAAATAFYALLSVVPLALLAVALSGHLLGAQEAYRKVADLLRAGMPEASSQALLSAIKVISRKEGRWFVYLVGLFGLLWSGMSLLTNLSVFLTRAWGEQPIRRAFLRQRLVALAAIGAAGTLFFLSLVFTSVASSLKHHPEWLSLLSDYLSAPKAPSGPVLSLVVGVAMFFLLYRFLPAARVTSAAALVGAVPAAILWHISRSLFGALVASSTRYGQVYGPLAGVVVFMLWVYYSAMILFLCAELAALYQEGRSR